MAFGSKHFWTLAWWNAKVCGLHLSKEMHNEKSKLQIREAMQKWLLLIKSNWRRRVVNKIYTFQIFQLLENIFGFWRAIFKLSNTDSFHHSFGKFETSTTVATSTSFGNQAFDIRIFSSLGRRDIIGRFRTCTCTIRQEHIQWFQYQIWEFIKRTIELCNKCIIRTPTSFWFWLRPTLSFSWWMSSPSIDRWSDPRSIKFDAWHSSIIMLREKSMKSIWRSPYTAWLWVHEWSNGLLEGSSPITKSNAGSSSNNIDLHERFEQ